MVLFIKHDYCGNNIAEIAYKNGPRSSGAVFNGHKI